MTICISGVMLYLVACFAIQILSPIETIYGQDDNGKEWKINRYRDGRKVTYVMTDDGWWSMGWTPSFSFNRAKARFGSTIGNTTNLYPDERVAGLTPPRRRDYAG